MSLASERETLPAEDAEIGWPVPWEPVWGQKDGRLERLQGHALLACMEIVALLPEWLLQGLIEVLSRVAKPVDRRRSRAARRFLLQALGPMPRRELERRVLQSYRHFFRVMADSQRFFRRFRGPEILQRFEVHWNDDVRRVISKRQGCLLITAHVGDWEAALAAAPWLGFGPVYAVARPPNNRVFSQATQSEREQRRIRLLPRRGAMQSAPSILRAGGAIGLVLDQRSRGRGALLAPFLGRPARCDRSAGVLMKRFRVPAVVCACTRAEEPLSYRIDFYDVLWPEEIRGVDLLTITTRINRAFERMILDHPDQYFWLHDRYKATPLLSGEPGFEDT